MSIISKMRKQTAVWWQAQTDGSGEIATDDYGQPQYNSPVQIICRWEDVAEEFMDANNEKAVSSSVVYVDRDMKAGDVLMLGTTDDIVDEINILENPNSGKIQKFAKTPNLRATEYLKVAYL